MERFRALLLGLPRRSKRLIQVAADVALVWLALWMAFVVRLGIDEMVNPITQHLWLFLCAPFVAIPLFFFFFIYLMVTRFFGYDVLIALF